MSARLKFLTTNILLVGSVVGSSLFYEKKKQELLTHLHREGLSNNEINKVVDQTFRYGTRSNVENMVFDESKSKDSTRKAHNKIYN